MKSTRIIASIALALVVGLSGGSMLKQTCEAQGAPIRNAFILHEGRGGSYSYPLGSIDFYTDVPSGREIFTVSIYDGDDTLTVNVYDPDNKWICGKKGFSNDGWDVLTAPLEEGGIYRINVSGEPNSDEYPSREAPLPFLREPSANRFWIDVNTDNLYSYSLQLIGDQNVVAWIDVPLLSQKFVLRHYDMDGKGLIYITDPDENRYGPFAPSGNDVWYEISMPTKGEWGKWRIEFTNLSAAGTFRIEAEVGGSPLKLHVK
jgi:hypothetical protein